MKVIRNPKDFRIVYSRACGIDVHKNFIVCTACIPGSKPDQWKFITRRFSTFYKELEECADWLSKLDCQNVCMESTGQYYIPVHDVLEKKLSNVRVVNPKWVKAVKGNKDDKKDSKWICQLFRFGMTKSSFIPGEDIRTLRGETRYRYKVISMRTSEMNRYQNALTAGGFKVDAVFSDVFGKSAQAIINLVLSGKEYTDKDILSLVHKNCKSSPEKILEAVNGIRMNDTQKKRLIIIKNHLDYLTDEIGEINKQIDCLVKEIPGMEAAIDHACMVPGIDKNLAVIIMSEIGTDMSPWPSQYNLVSWAGLSPGDNQSAGKKKSVKISRAGVYLKPALVEAAHAAVKDKEHPYYAIKYNTIKKRRGQKRAIIAIARKLLIAIYHMLLTGEKWNPTDLANVETPTDKRRKYIKKNLSNSFSQLENTGMLPEEIINYLKGQFLDLEASAESEDDSDSSDNDSSKGTEASADSAETNDSESPTEQPALDSDSQTDLTLVKDKSAAS